MKKMKAKIVKILRQWCERKVIEMIEAEYCQNHTYAHWHAAQIQCVKNSWIFTREKVLSLFLIDM